MSCCQGFKFTKTCKIKNPEEKLEGHDGEIILIDEDGRECEAYWFKIPEQSYPQTQNYEKYKYNWDIMDWVIDEEYCNKWDIKF